MGATHLFVGVPDCLYGDNSDPNSDNGVEIIVILSTPALSTGATLLLMSIVILAGVWVVRRKLIAA